MSPFWKNVNDELYYQGMNLKTLSQITGIPYTTITNGRNRSNSIPTADIALKIAKALNKPLESLLGECSILPNENAACKKEQMQELYLYKKYEQLILFLEENSTKTQKAFVEFAEALSSDCCQKETRLSI